MSWLTRDQLAESFPPREQSSGFLLGAIPGESCVSVSRDERAALIEQSAATLAAAGITSGDRVIVSLANDGNLVGGSLAEALVGLGAAAAVVDPRGRMRLLAAIRTLRPNVWVTTPTGALDFLARLYLEFNVDPMELDLEQILLVGEIGSPGTERRLADEFEARVTGLYCDPIFGVALAHGRENDWRIQNPSALGFADLGDDSLHPASQDSTDLSTDPHGHATAATTRKEIVLRPVWSASLAKFTIRTGEVVDPSGQSTGTNFFAQTVGEHVLIRGRWLSIPLLRRGLAGIDGIAGWRLGISRGEGTLDKLVLNLAFERAGLVENPMWAGRAREAIASVTPIAFEIETERATTDTPPEAIDDQRAHHLGLDRKAIAQRLGGRCD